MMERRRSFLRVFAAVLAGTVSGQSFAFQEKRRSMPEPPTPASPKETKREPGDPQSSQRAMLKLNEKEFRESLAHLYDRVSELKRDVETLHTTDIFSMKLYKQTDEIEHLAKRLRSLARI
jgi:hypothetical protein